MNSKNEIVTLQFGHYSNYIGAHWWNIQDANFVYTTDTKLEINYDALYREGETYKRVQTFTPRLLLVDLKGSLHNLPVNNTLYHNVESDFSEVWDENKIEVYEEPKCEKNEFLKDVEKVDSEMECVDEVGVTVTTKKQYNLNESVSVWSDYCSSVFHPRTIHIVNDYRHDDDQKKFNIFTQGVETSKNEFFANDWVDKCRLYVEECDQLQGFQVLFDCFDANGGLSRAALEHIKDEYSSKPVIAFPAMCTNSSNTCSDDNAIRTINTVLSFDSLIDFSSIFVPLCVNREGWKIPGNPREFPYLNYDNTASYHTAAILASYLDTISLIYRKRGRSLSLAELCCRWSPIGRICLAATLALPFDVNTDSSLLNILENRETALWTSIMPYCEPHVDSSYVQDIVLRGFGDYDLYSSKDLKKNPGDPTYNCNNAQELFSLYLNFSSMTKLPTERCNIDSFDTPMKTNLSFPAIFCENDQGTPRRLEKCSVVAGLHNSKSCKTTLSTLYEDAKKIQLRSYPQFFASGHLDNLDYDEALEHLISLSEDYK